MPMRPSRLVTTLEWAASRRLQIASRGSATPRRQPPRRVGFGTWALAVKLRPKPLAGPAESREARKTDSHGGTLLSSFRGHQATAIGVFAMPTQSSCGASILKHWVAYAVRLTQRITFDAPLASWPPSLSGEPPSSVGYNARIPGLQATDPGLHARAPGLQATDLGLHARTPGLQATDPGLLARTSGLQATDPGLHARTPGLQATNPGLHPLVGFDTAPRAANAGRITQPLAAATPERTILQVTDKKW
jgi:hypothetical protein